MTLLSLPFVHLLICELIWLDFVLEVQQASIGTQVQRILIRVRNEAQLFARGDRRRRGYLEGNR